MITRLGFSRALTTILAPLALLACSTDLQIGGGSGGSGGGASTTTTTTNGTTTTTTTTATGTNNGCAAAEASTIPGVRIEITSNGCTLSLADPTLLTIEYQVVVDADVPGVRPVPEDAGGCGEPGASGLILFEEIAGGTQQYCLCDVGICPGTPQPVATLKKGTYPASLAWDGRNWGGPSDTANPKGPPFAVGDYEFKVRAKGFLTTANGEVPFAIETAMPVHVVP